MSSGRIRAGIGGWTFADWRGSFYPKGLPQDQELAYAAARLTSIEINGTFYRTQSAASFAKWRDAVPDDFVFSLKAPRVTTHRKELGASAESVARFLNSGIAELGPKLGPILWQFPPTRQFDAAALESFLALLPTHHAGLPLRHAIEARHPSFQDIAWVALLRAHGIAMAIIDSDKQALVGDLTAPFAYLRLQRNHKNSTEGYEFDLLDQWLTRARRWASGTSTDLDLIDPRANITTESCDVYAYFISGDKICAPTAAQAFLRRLGPVDAVSDRDLR